MTALEVLGAAVRSCWKGPTTWMAAVGLLGAVAHCACSTAGLGGISCPTRPRNSQRFARTAATPGWPVTSPLHLRQCRRRRWSRSAGPLLQVTYHGLGPNDSLWPRLPAGAFFGADVRNGKPGHRSTGRGGLLRGGR